MRKRFKEFLCWLLGHRSRCLSMWHSLDDYNRPISTTTAWQCERCMEPTTEQWDW